MALVAYSDDSDLGSDPEEVEEQVNGFQNISENEVIPKLPSTSSVPQANASTASQETKISSGVDTIVDEDDFENISSKKSSSLLSSIPAAIPVNSIQNEVGEGEDELNDVPTLNTWKITAEIQKDKERFKSTATSSTDKKSFDPPKKKAKSKVKFFVPALSEFADDDEEEEPKEEPQRKKVMPSTKGTGLFSVLPEPKHISVKETKRPLIPHILTKPPSKQKPLKPKPAPKSKVEEANESDEDNDDSSDFFSLSEPTASGLDTAFSAPAQAVKTIAASVPSVQDHLPRNVGRMETSDPLRQTQLPTEAPDYEQQQKGVSYEFQPEMQVPEDPTNIDQEALIKLMGKRRRKGEEINFINVSADDALLTRDEWMTKALTEEKPTHSYSKKREGLPSQKQKQKHQITYLAHQAKERELELKNNWAQNRMTKMQTQAKYGF